MSKSPPLDRDRRPLFLAFCVDGTNFPSVAGSTDVVCGCVRVVWAGLGWAGLGWAGLVWSGLVWSGLDFSGLGWHGGMVTGQLVSIQIPTPRYIQSQNEQNILLDWQPW